MTDEATTFKIKLQDVRGSFRIICRRVFLNENLGYLVRFRRKPIIKKFYNLKSFFGLVAGL